MMICMLCCRDTLKRDMMVWLQGKHGRLCATCARMFKLGLSDAQIISRHIRNCEFCQSCTPELVG